MTDHAAMRFEFFAWAAARAAMAGSSKATVSQLRSALVTVAIVEQVERADWDAAEAFDAWHHDLVTGVIQALNSAGRDISYGIGAKLVNVFIKGYWLMDTGGPHTIARFAHPAIDSILLGAIDRAHGTGFKRLRWQKLDHDAYVQLIGELRQLHGGDAIWELEGLWSAG
ncbi:MAG: hypothetical protein PF961_11910 [Planctomycetota bacterium]|nr:hypothetical protein [Planctomycetota bacterium]